MIHVATVHWPHPRWVDLQLRYLERNLDEPYRVYAWIDGWSEAQRREHAHKFFYSTHLPIERHELKLTVLGDLVAHAAAPDETLIFMDGDAFPIAPVGPFLREKLERYPLVAVRRDENNGDRQPHPSFCAMKARFWLELPGDWRRGRTWRNLQGKEITDVGGNLLGLLEDKGTEWYPMLRSNKVNPHQLQFGVYEDLVYHQGGGFRRTAGGRIGRLAMREELAATWRGRLAARLPSRGPLGVARRLVYPVRRHRHAMAAKVAEANERVYELILRDEDFYLQLIEPERGGELTRLTVPTR
jgi:hypothetical protein